MRFVPKRLRVSCLRDSERVRPRGFTRETYPRGYSERAHPKEHTRENGTELDKKGYVIVTIEKKGNVNDSNIEVPRRKTEDC